MRLHLDLACVKFSDTQKKLEETTKKLEEKVNVLEKNIHWSEEKCDSFTWRMNGFSEVLRKAKSGEETRINSSSFFRYGYKCKLNVAPNGVGRGENTHLSIYLKIMKGEYDAILTWPIDKKVTFTLIDQQENANDRKNIVRCFATSNVPELFKRPVKDENAGQGFHQFVSQKNLQERRYIVDDTIFIQVHITSPE